VIGLLAESQQLMNADFRDAEFDDTLLLKSGDLSGVFTIECHPLFE
jgi:hypothetical protein